MKITLNLSLTLGCFIAWFILGFPFDSDWWIAFGICMTIDLFKSIRQNR